MNISKFDVGLLFILSLAVVLISFTGPVFGLTNADATNSSQIPNLTVGQNAFDNVGEEPEPPTSNPSGGTLNYTSYPIGSNRTDPAGQGINRQFITGSYQNVNGIEIAITKYPTGPNDTANILVNEWSGGALVYQANITVKEGDSINYQNQSQGVVVQFEVRNVDHDLYGNGTLTAETDYQVEQTPSDQGFINNLPIVGGVVSTADTVGPYVAWIGSILLYYVNSTVEALLNAGLMVIQTTAYLISMMNWMFGTYLSVVSGAPGWASVIVALPGVLLAGELAKFVAVGVSLLPTT